MEAEETTAVPLRSRPLVVAALVTIVVAALSWLLPQSWRATAVGLGFLAATWLLVLRGDDEKVARHGLSLGGIFEPSPLDVRRVARDTAIALGWAALVSAIVFPPFVIAFPIYNRIAIGHALTWGHAHFALRSTADEVLGQLLVIALSEEAFYRGYLQTALDAKWPPSWKVLGARIGPSLLVTSAIFAVGHVLTDPRPARLAVFFPSLLFGWLRARTGGIGASLTFHAACNVLAETLARGYGLVR